MSGLHYTEVCLSPLEVPGESSICIYLSGCINRCHNCHYPELQKEDYRDALKLYYKDIIALYLHLATCVCFLGEGKGTGVEQQELSECAKYAHGLGLKTCLYSGRDTGIEPWMHVFDYIKLGSYQEEAGPLSSRTTNQRFYVRKFDSHYKDITAIFYKQSAGIKAN